MIALTVTFQVIILAMTVPDRCRYLYVTRLLKPANDAVMMMMTARIMSCRSVTTSHFRKVYRRD